MLDEFDTLTMDQFTLDQFPLDQLLDQYSNGRVLLDEYSANRDKLIQKLKNQMKNIVKFKTILVDWGRDNATMYPSHYANVYALY